MALIGVVALFWVTDASFDSSAKIGLVLLFGVVVNNAILLLNRFRLELRAAVAAQPALRATLADRPRLGGSELWVLPPGERLALLSGAICDGMRIQLRSVLLTSGTTIAGLLPLLIQITERTEGKDIWENLALSSIGGLTSSTVLILGVVPALYWTFTRWGWGLARLRQWWSTRRAVATAAPDGALPVTGDG